VFDARQIANWFILRAKRDGKVLSIMQLLKLVYIAHGWHLEMRNRPLFFNRIEVWRRGPVIRDIYTEFRNKGIDVHEPSTGHLVELPPEYDRFLEQIYDIYGKKSAYELSDLTHKPGSPWDMVHKSKGLFATITDDVIRPHYIGLREAARKTLH